MCIALLSPTPLALPSHSLKEKVKEKRSDSRLSTCNIRGSASQAPARPYAVAGPKTYWVVPRALANSEQNKQVGDDTLARETMKAEEDTSEVQDFMTKDEELALVHSKQEEILNYVKLLLQREELVLQREKLVLEENAHLKEEIAAEREKIRFLQAALHQSQELVQEVLQITLQKEDKVRDVETSPKLCFTIQC